MSTVGILDDECKEIQTIGRYLLVRRLPDGSVAALQDLLFTRALYLGCNTWGWEQRFCYDDAGRANEEFERLRSAEDVPCGWIARRPDLSKSEHHSLQRPQV